MKNLIKAMAGAVTILAVCTSTCALAAQGADISVEVNGARVEFDVPPQIIEGRTMLPVRAVFEALGANVEWNQDEKMVTAVKGDYGINMRIGSEIIYSTDDSKKIFTDVAPVIIDGRTLVPVRAAAESFDYAVEWNEESRLVRIFEKDENYVEPEQNSCLETEVFAKRMNEYRYDPIDNIVAAYEGVGLYPGFEEETGLVWCRATNKSRVGYLDVTITGEIDEAHVTGGHFAAYNVPVWEIYPTLMDEGHETAQFRSYLTKSEFEDHINQKTELCETTVYTDNGSHYLSYELDGCKFIVYCNENGDVNVGTYGYSDCVVYVIE